MLGDISAQLRPQILTNADRQGASIYILAGNPQAALEWVKQANTFNWYARRRKRIYKTCATVPYLVFGNGC